jgi:hypothetical protein
MTPTFGDDGTVTTELAHGSPPRPEIRVGDGGAQR